MHRLPSPHPSPAQASPPLRLGSPSPALTSRAGTIWVPLLSWSLEAGCASGSVTARDFTVEWWEPVRVEMGLEDVGLINEVFSFELLGCEWRGTGTTVAGKGYECNKGLPEEVRKLVVISLFFGLVVIGGIGACLHAEGEEPAGVRNIGERN